MALFNFLKKGMRKRTTKAPMRIKKEEEPSVAPTVAPTVAKAVAGKKEKEPSAKKEEVKKIAKKAEKISSRRGKFAHVLLAPRITEKATILAEQNVYTFNVSPRANKIEVKQAIREIYNVEPVKVRMTTIPYKTVSVRGRRGQSGVRGGGKKATVYLKEGETIEFV